MNQQKTLIGLNLAVFMMMLGVGMIMALLPQRIIDLTGSEATVGYLASAFAISYILLQVPLGNLSDRFGFKFFLAFGYLCCFLTGILYYFSNNPALFFLGRALQGVGEAPVWALAPALLSIKYAESKGKAMGIYNAAIHLGLTIGPLLGIILLKLFTGNQPFLFYAAACLTGALIIFFSVENAKGTAVTGEPAINLQSFIVLATTKKSLLTLLGITLYGAGYGMFLTTIPAFLISNKNFGPTLVGLFFALFYVAISISQLITGGLSDKFGRRLFMIVGLIIAASGIAVFPGFDRPLIFVILGIGSLGLGIFYLSSMAYLNEVVPNSLKGTITGAYYLFWGIGFFCGPVVISRLGESGHSRLGYLLFSLLLLFEAVVLLFNNRCQGKFLKVL